MTFNGPFQAKASSDSVTLLVQDRHNPVPLSQQSWLCLAVTQEDRHTGLCHHLAEDLG